MMATRLLLPPSLELGVLLEEASVAAVVVEGTAAPSVWASAGLQAAAATPERLCTPS